jgi:ribonuclease III
MELETALGHTFHDAGLLRLALTHRSYSNERGEEANFERLEFLGDSVLGLVAAAWLYEHFPANSEGELAKRKSYLVSAAVLSQHAERIGVGEELLLGVGEERSGGRAKASILADAMEALLGAVYLDAGFAAARQVILPILAAAHAGVYRPGTDAKTRLQEMSQARGWGLPVYHLTAEKGPDHEKIFTVECWVEERRLGRAEGGSKKLAEQAAAAVALARLDLPPSGT